MRLWPWGKDDEAEKIVGFVATPSSYATLELEHEGHVLFSEPDDRGRMAWPSAPSLRTYVEYGDDTPRPYVLLSGAILQQATLPDMPGFVPDRAAIQAPFNERAARAATNSSAYLPDDPMSSLLLMLPLALVGVMALVVVAMFSPRFVDVLGTTNINMTAVGVFVGLMVLFGIGFLIIQRRSGKEKRPEPSSSPLWDDEGGNNA